MGYRQDKLIAKTEVGADTLGEVLRRIVGVVHVPLKFVLVDNPTDTHIDGDGSDLFEGQTDHFVTRP